MLAARPDDEEAAVRVVVMQFTTLDGVTQGPGSPDEDTSDGFAAGGWFVPFLDATFEAQATAWTLEADAFLLGRRTYEGFAEAWPLVTDPGDAIAAALNGRPKHVVSTTLRDAPWGPAEIMGDDVAARVTALRDAPGRELQVHGSTTLASWLLAAGLVDELRLAIAPVVLGAGRRLFPPGGAPLGLRPIRSETTPGGLAIHEYAVAGPPGAGSYSRAATGPPDAR
jgi:dihydrofolate reductase